MVPKTAASPGTRESDVLVLTSSARAGRLAESKTPARKTPNSSKGRPGVRSVFGDSMQLPLVHWVREAMGLDRPMDPGILARGAGPTSRRQGRSQVGQVPD